MPHPASYQGRRTNHKRKAKKARTQATHLNSVLNEIKAVLSESGLAVFDEREIPGLLRELLQGRAQVTAPAEGEALPTLQQPRRDPMLPHLDSVVGSLDEGDEVTLQVSVKRKGGRTSAFSTPMGSPAVIDIEPEAPPVDPKQEVLDRLESGNARMFESAKAAGMSFDPRSRSYKGGMHKAGGGGGSARLAAAMAGQELSSPRKTSDLLTPEEQRELVAKATGKRPAPPAPNPFSHMKDQ